MIGDNQFYRVMEVAFMISSCDGKLVEILIHIENLNKRFIIPPGRIFNLVGTCFNF